MRSTLYTLARLLGWAAAFPLWLPFRLLNCLIGRHVARRLWIKRR